MTLLQLRNSCNLPFSGSSQISLSSITGDGSGDAIIIQNSSNQITTFDLSGNDNCFLAQNGSGDLEWTYSLPNLGCDTLAPYSLGGISITDGLYLPTTGGTPALLSNYEVWTSTAVASGPWPSSSNPTLNIRIVCIGKCCIFEWSPTGPLEEADGSADVIIEIPVGSIPTRFYPGLSSLGGDYMVGSCLLEDTGWNNKMLAQVQMDGGGVVGWIPPINWTGNIGQSATLFAGYVSWITS